MVSQGPEQSHFSGQYHLRYLGIESGETVKGLFVRSVRKMRINSSQKKDGNWEKKSLH